MREMILADDEAGRKKALAKLLPYQRADFEGLFKVMSGKPVIIRFLDPPLHEFLPKEDKEIAELSKAINVPAEKIKAKISELHEFNPMLGFRGCRLGVVYPEISEMQARAVFEAALNCKKAGIDAMPEIEIPNIISLVEFKFIKGLVQKVAKETGIEGKVHYKIGTMIEFPRAAFIADELATEAEFMSFGTNDLTQTTLGFSRDDSGKFIPSYLDRNIFEKDPFQTIDQEGVGKVMKLALTKARSTRKDIDMGICGEHGGDPASVEFCHRIGLSNVSCSPYRVPIAMLAAAQASIRGRMTNVIANQKQSTTDARAIKGRMAQPIKPNTQNKQVIVQSQNKPVSQNKPAMKGVSIRDEIRNIVRQEMGQMKQVAQQNNQQRKTMVIQVQKKPVQNNQVARVSVIQNLPKNIEQKINAQVQKKQQTPVRQEEKKK
jgi:phosphoenolpyruvate-protein kinase (PTS system EI component)